jgi:hypothetical protein
MGLDNDDIKALIAILQKGLSDNDESESSITPKPKKKPVKPKTISKKKSLNKFEAMPEFNMCKSDSDFDRKVIRQPPTLRKEPFKYIDAQCRVCGKKESVAPDFIESIDRYKCNKCSTGAG